MEKYLYLLIDLSCIAIPFAFSFHKKIQFYTVWKYFLPANFFTAIFFLIWDEYFTQIGVWGFNPTYLTGYYIGNLPIEEILFFFCIPYACVFTYFALQKITSKSMVKNANKIHFIFILFFIIMVPISYPKYYSFSTFTLCFVFSIIMRYGLKKHLANFYAMYFLILLPFLISNGILTGSFLPEPIVWYNNQENFGLRFLTIPVEDFFYGYLLLACNVFGFEKLKAKFK